MPNEVAGIILAAGKGTRMKSELPKCAHAVCGLPMVEHIARAMKGAGVERPIIVIGHGGEKIQELLGDGYDYVWQHEQLGTGHAVLMAKDKLEGFDGPVFVSAGDTPLVSADFFKELLAGHRESCADATAATSVVADPFGYGRIVRDENGRVVKNVEHKDATPEQLKINEVNAAIYCIDAKTLLRLLPTLGNNNAQGEYYLTDILEAITKEGGAVVGQIFSDPGILVGINDRWQLANAEKELRRRILQRHAVNGVTILDIDSVFVGPDVEIGPDTVLDSSTHLTGKCRVGSGCRLGPFTRINNSEIGDGSSITMSYVDKAFIGSGVAVGPFAHLRPNARLRDGVRIGNFVEIKNAEMGPESKANHLAYIGDATVGAKSNIGAGTITCNYDGFSKHQTNIGAETFVGSNSTLVAPVSIGDGAMIAAGSVINKDVPEGAAAFGRARQETKPEWAAQWRKVKLSRRPSTDEA